MYHPPLYLRWPWNPNAEQESNELPRAIYTHWFPMTGEAEFPIPAPAPGMRWTGIRVWTGGIRDMQTFRVMFQYEGENPAIWCSLLAAEHQWTMLPLMLLEQGDAALRIRIRMPDQEQYSGRVEFLAQRIG